MTHLYQITNPEVKRASPKMKCNCWSLSPGSAAWTQKLNLPWYVKEVEKMATNKSKQEIKKKQSSNSWHSKQKSNMKKKNAPPPPPLFIATFLDGRLSLQPTRFSA